MSKKQISYTPKSPLIQDWYLDWEFTIILVNQLLPSNMNYVKKWIFRCLIDTARWSIAMDYESVPNRDSSRDGLIKEFIKQK